MKRDNEMNGVEYDFKSKATVSPRMTIPELFWDEWRADCMAYHNDTFYLKMMHDHMLAKSVTSLTAIYEDRILQLEEQLKALEDRLSAAQQPQTQGRKTFGSKE